MRAYELSTEGDVFRNLIAQYAAVIQVINPCLRSESSRIAVKGGRALNKVAFCVIGVKLIFPDTPQEMLSAIFGEIRDGTVAIVSEHVKEGEITWWFAGDFGGGIILDLWEDLAGVKEAERGELELGGYGGFFRK